MLVEVQSVAVPLALVTVYEVIGTPVVCGLFHVTVTVPVAAPEIATFVGAPGPVVE